MMACISPSSKLLSLLSAKSMETGHEGQQPNLFDHWADRYQPSYPATKEIHE